MRPHLLLGGAKTILVETTDGTITYLSCPLTELTALDVSDAPELEELYCHNNKLPDLDLSDNTALTALNCGNNQMDAAALDALFGTLHSNPGTKTIGCSSNPGYADCDKTIFTDKGWTEQ